MTPLLRKLFNNLTSVDTHHVKIVDMSKMTCVDRMLNTNVTTSKLILVHW